MALPKRTRDILTSDVVSLEVSEYDQIPISPIRNLGGALAAYQKATSLPFEAIRKQAWEDSISAASHQ